MNLQPIGSSGFIHSNKMFFLFLDGIWCSFLKLKKYSIF
ncbi:hypothetical protein LEP1GSC083_3287 [Leptospira interrogans serovar Pyrogenes str. L0374]|uniref:Uncharacterized protein n=2 Tax=Leptospira interrogans serovar Pyrogenes TaxID=280500 RepID=M6ZRR5_LEPIR|nr:hypothetical protein LEP1GSC007_1978 [Leptospira interrogans serovar Bulgarica str. Mallika]EKO04389.1 hypothetical protein LEP1GSC077_0209 [Leptospira interrogans str. C10069]EMN28553.1 hypothetical protein LEP1GSC083_3287 [Leptospira interrogans serovar Pyrogenes str. L0374]EMN62371.1 hypothetical protein LEP1GSC092_1864 [Leptospira interrogans serovar Pyrogenes str. R168]EMP08756.1 hypothetical protein LEP1GSC124_3423 [Leptospira interrogans serovar Pyrogenes str. 200701872]